MRHIIRRIDAIRRRCSEVENDLIDEFLAGRVGRRELLRHGAVLGMATPLLAGLAGGLGAAAFPTAARAATAGTIRVAQTVPAGAIDPVTIADSGGLIQLCQTGEYLALSGGDLRLRPVLAESWKPNADGSGLDLRAPQEREVP